MRPGDVLANRFQLQAETGRGGMGHVFRAHDRFSGALVAVKLLRERRAGWDARFLRESEMLASLHHPAIVRHVAHGACPGGERYLVMEWLSGEDLASRLARGPLSLDDTLALSRQVADALALAHGRGVVHRDLKPHNLWLVDSDPARVKVLDFGVARLESHSSLSHSALIGTPGYMAPEQVRGAFDVDARADVFALGCVMHECMTGQPLFRADHLIGLLAKILLEPAPPLRSALPALPVYFDALVSEMVAKPREQRPGDGAEVRRRLDGGVRGSVPSDTLSMAELRSRTLLLIGSGVGTDGSTPDFAHSTPGVAEQRVRNIVAAHGGSLEQFADGTAIASFGDTVATDRAARAARCALALAPVCPQRALSLVTGRGDEATRIGAAIDRGTAALASVSAEQGGGPIAVDALTANLLDARFELRETAHGVLLTCERALNQGARLLLGKATACVGRDYELASLRAAFAACAQERVARAVLVSAPAGIGKSRLAIELVERLRREQPPAVWLARGDPLRTGSAFGLLAQLLRAQLALREDDPLPQRQASIRERVRLRFERVADVERVASFLGELLAAPFDDHDNAPLRTARRDPELMHDQLSRAFVDFVRAELAAGPLLWILEDLHWADLPSMRFIDAALGQLAEQPWLVLALARPELLERAPRLWAERGLAVVHLKPLSPNAGARLVAQAVELAVDDPRVSKLVELAAGNAFYLEELARAMGDGNGKPPETVLAMIDARLQGLDDEQRRVLRAASIFGEACWQGGLSRLMGGELDPVRLHHCLTRLIAEELLMVRAESRFVGERELAFRHALLREGAYAQLTPEDRRLGHRLAADWLEQHGEPSPAVLALHLEHGGELARAGLRYASAARVANLGADREAVLAHARSGLRCGVPDRVAGELHNLIIKLLGQRSEFHAAQPHIEALARLSAADSALRLSYQLVPIMVHAMGADRAPDLERLSSALESAVSAPLSEATLDVFGAVVGWTHFELDAMGEYAFSRRTSERYTARLLPFAEREATAAGWLALQVSHENNIFRDDPAAGWAAAERAARAFEEAEHPGGRAVARTFLGLHAYGLGAHEEAVRALQSAREVEIGTVGSLRDFLLVLALLDGGRIDEADAASRALVQSARDRPDADGGRAHWARALVLLHRRDHVGCERELAPAQQQLARYPIEQSGTLLTLATLLTLTGELERALHCCDRARATHERMHAAGYAGLVGRILPARRAEVLLAMGRTDEARVQVELAEQHVLAVANRIGDAALRARFLTRQVHAVRTLALADKLKS